MRSRSAYVVVEVVEGGKRATQSCLVCDEMMIHLSCWPTDERPTNLNLDYLKIFKFESFIGTRHFSLPEKWANALDDDHGRFVSYRQDRTIVKTKKLLLNFAFFIPNLHRP